VDALETLYAERRSEQVERLAHHAMRGEVWDKALCYYRQAGAMAEARSAYREAVMCFEQALGAVQHLPGNRDTIEQAIDLRLELRNVLSSPSKILRRNALLPRSLSFLRNNLCGRSPHDLPCPVVGRARASGTGTP
jgi:hypothetical protein